EIAARYRVDVRRVDVERRTVREMHADLGLAVLRSARARDDQRAGRAVPDRLHDQLVVAGPVDDAAAKRPRLANPMIEADVPRPASRRLQIRCDEVTKLNRQPNPRDAVAGVPRVG